jgi:hypothetical protein
MTKRRPFADLLCGFYPLAGIEWILRLNRTQCAASRYHGRNAISGIAKSAYEP